MNFLLLLYRKKIGGGKSSILNVQRVLLPPTIFNSHLKPVFFFLIHLLLIEFGFGNKILMVNERLLSCED